MEKFCKEDKDLRLNANPNSFDYVQAVASLAFIRRLVRPPTAYQQRAYYNQALAVAHERLPANPTIQTDLGLYRIR